MVIAESRFYFYQLRSTVETMLKPTSR